MSTEIDAIEYLTSKGYRGRDTSGVEVTYPCFFGCDEPADSSKRKLYVNRDTGLFHCKVCEAYGGTTLLMRHFGDEPERSEAAPYARRAAVLESVVRAGERLLRADDAVMLELLGDGRWLPPEVIESRRLGFIGNRSLLGTLPIGEFTSADIESAGITWQSGPTAGQDFFRNCVLLPYIERGRIVQVRGKSRETGRYYTGPGESVRLYNVDALAGADEVLLVEGEFDTMATAHLLHQSPDLKVRSIAVVGLPGVQSLPEDLAERLADVKRIWIGTDPDEAGRRGAEKLKEKLGPRAHILDWPEELLRQAQADGYQLKQIDWSLWIGRYGATWQDIVTMIRSSGRLASMAMAGSRARNRSTTGIKLGFAELDAWLHPGLQPGNLMIPLAKTGTGKTVWLSNVAYNLRNRRVLFVTLEQTQEEIYSLLLRIYRFYRPAATHEEIEFALSDLRICDENRLTEADFAQLVEEYTESVGAPPELAIVDYLGYYSRGFKGGSPYEKTSNAVMQLKAEAKKHRLAIIAPHQVNRLGKAGKPLDADDARDSGVVEETADFMLGIYRPDDALEVNGGQVMPTGHLKAELLKSRRGHKGRVANLQMGLLSLVVLDAVNPLAKQAANECWLYGRGVTYDQYLSDRQPKPTQLPLRGSA